ncbi:adenylosuccinate synthase [Peptococcus simiae]|uniref:adenylosuccinate synthase n=1 Tax=Peptococcus simiae TaxID=1643805 RepID=UPI00397EA1E5
MPGLVLLGSQWGDEGKGKVTDYLAEEADLVVRYQGGNNAGHTVVVNGEEFKLRLIPSGIINGNATCVIGNGVVVDIHVLRRELDYLKERKVDVSRLRISDRCHLIMPYHILQDECEEKAKGNLKIGTTKNGIGPCYMDKCARIGLRMGDLLDPDRFKSRLEEVLPIKNNLLSKLYGEKTFEVDEVLREMTEDIAFLKDMVCDSSWLLHEALTAGKKVMFEGAQGTLLDLDHGTYPYVTSSNPISGGAAVGAGVAPWQIQNVLGIVKAYTTRVGAGPFPTELEDDMGQLLQERGHEFGTVTGRTRRCGWLDMAVVNYAIRLSGMTALALMKLDVLDSCETIQIATGYRLDGQVIDHFPASLDDLERVEPIYESLPGWQEDTSACRRFEDLPKAAQDYVNRIETLAGIPVKIVAVGPGREETIVRDAIF